MADVVAGGSTGEGPVSVALTADVSGWERQLQRAGTAVDRFAKQSEQKFAKASAAVKQSSGESGGALGRVATAIAGGAAGGGVVGAATAAFALLAEQASKALKEIAFGATNAAQKTLALQRAATATTDAVARMNAAAGERLAAVVDPGERIGEISRQLEEATAQQRKFKEATDASAKKLDEINSTFSGEGWNLWLNGKFDDAVKKHESQLQALGQNYDAVTGKVKDLGKAKREALDPTKDSAFVGSVNQITADLDKQVATWGKAADAVKLYELRLKDTTGKAKGMLDKLEAKVNATAEALKQKELNKSFEELAKQIAGETAAIGKTAEQAKYLDAVSRGFNKDQLERIKALLTEQEQKRLAFERASGGGPKFDATLAGSKEATAAILAANRAATPGKGPGALPAGAKEMLNVLNAIKDQGAKALYVQQRSKELLEKWNERDMKTPGIDD